jgi:shikimate dehydrogenase
MKKFISLSQYPGKTGQYFYTKFFEHYNIDADYEPRATDDLPKSIARALEENIDGISVSMPFKKQVLNYLDKTTAYTEMYQSCNTIIVDDKKLVGYNADISGVEWACKNIKTGDRITVLGNGAMAAMFIKYLENDHYGHLNLASRSLGTWYKKDQATDILINATALGTSTADSPFTKLPDDVRLVIDLAIPNNNLRQQCLDAKVKYLSGKEFYKQQFLTQFKIYTGIEPDSKLFDDFESQRHERI